MINYKCPGKKIECLLDALNVDRFREVSETRNYGLKDITERLKNGFPNWPDERLRELAQVAKADYVRNKQIFLMLKRYGDRLIDISEGLGNHVKDCIGEGGCFDRYSVWLERNAREIVQREMISNDELPGVIRELDLRTLDLLFR